MGIVSTQCECDRCLRSGMATNDRIHPEGWHEYHLFEVSSEKSKFILLCVECQKDLRRWFADRGSITL